VYKNYDPRATIIKHIADEVFTVTGRSPLLDIALELERIALGDKYFVGHKLYPNVDFYSGIIYQATGFPVAMFPVLFTIGRMPGWLAQWQKQPPTRNRKSPAHARSTPARSCTTSTAHPAEPPLADPDRHRQTRSGRLDDRSLKPGQARRAAAVCATIDSASDDGSVTRTGASAKLSAR
jgi:hypothetical protein